LAEELVALGLRAAGARRFQRRRDASLAEPWLLAT